MTTHTLTLAGMRFFGHHGVYLHETDQGQPFGATVSLELPSVEIGAPGFDRLDDTVDYTAVHAVVRSVVEGPPLKLIESLAEEVAAALLAAFPRALSAEVEIQKPKPPVDFAFDGVAVRVLRRRER